MNIRANRNPGQYYTLHKHAARDAELSWKAFGVHCYLMSHADQWEANVEQLTKAKLGGKTIVRNAVNELLEKGYARRVQERDEDGKFIKVRIDVYERPEDNPEFGLPQAENPQAGKPQAENRPLNNNKSNNNKKNNSSAATQPALVETPEPESSVRTDSSGKKESKAYVNEDTGYSTNDIAGAFFEVVEAYEPGAIHNIGQTMRSAKLLAEAGWRPEDVAGCYVKLKADEFWQRKALTLTTVAKNIGAKMTHPTVQAKEPEKTLYRGMQML